MLSTAVTAQSPREELPKFGPGLNTFAVDRGLIGIRKRYASNMEIFVTESQSNTSMRWFADWYVVAR
jgi:hypothetical protein